MLMREKFRQQPSQSKERQGVQLLVSKLFFGSERLGSSPGRSALQSAKFFFWLVAAWVKSRAERPSVSGVNRQLHVQIGRKLGIRNRKEF